MALLPLESVRHAVEFGVPLAFGIRDAAGRLLLARGRVVENAAQLEALLERGAFVDGSEAPADPAARVASASLAELPGLWDEHSGGVGRTLRQGAAPGRDDFTRTLDASARPLAALVERDADLALFQVLAGEEAACGGHAERRAVSAGIAARLATGVLGWDEAASQRAFRATLTMNLAMTELMNTLASQLTPLTAAQREQIQQHPLRSVATLEAAGVTDRDWLDAVAQHHAYDNEHGYPKGLGTVGELALLLQRCDRYTAKLSARASRPAMAPDVAARQMFQADRGHPLAAALVKAFGLYPPGTAVRLASGEQGIVVRRGEAATTPLVAVLVGRDGGVLPVPRPRDSARKEHAVVAVVPRGALKVRFGTAQLVACLAHA